MAFAYRDRYGVLHCTKNYDNAVNYAKGKVVAGNFLCKQGYPVVYGKKVFSYSNGDTYWGSNRKEGKLLKECDSQTAQAILQLLNKVGI